DHVFVTDRRLLLGRHGRRHLATTASAALPIASASFSIASTARDRSTPSRSSALKAAIIAVIAAAMANCAATAGSTAWRLRSAVFRRKCFRDRPHAAALCSPGFGGGGAVRGRDASQRFRVDRRQYLRR